jgi:hypothetical protein
MMNRLLFSFLLLINIGGFANAQKADTTKNASIQKIYDLIKAKGKPLIVIDGIIYKADSKPFDTEDISAIDMLHPPGSINIYGEQAADGAILISTRNSNERDTLSDLHKKEILDNLTYVLNGEPSTDKEISALKPEDILSFTALKYDKESVSEEFKSKRTLVVITKSFAKNSYQATLSKFSKEYKNCLDSTKHDDSKFFYVLNGQPLEVEDKRIQSLFDIHENQIKKVHFMGKFYKGVINNQKEVVLVQTK